jgi:hypothetical protein
MGRWGRQLRRRQDRPFRSRRGDDVRGEHAVVPKQAALRPDAATRRQDSGEEQEHVARSHAHLDGDAVCPCSISPLPASHRHLDPGGTTPRNCTLQEPPRSRTHIARNPEATRPDGRVSVRVGGGEGGASDGHSIIIPPPGAGTALQSAARAVSGSKTTRISANKISLCIELLLAKAARMLVAFALPGIPRMQDSVPHFVPNGRSISNFWSAVPVRK